MPVLEVVEIADPRARYGAGQHTVGRENRIELQPPGCLGDRSTTVRQPVCCIAPCSDGGAVERRRRSVIRSSTETRRDPHLPAKLADELTCVEYDYTDRGRIRLDRKSDIMDSHGFSPDRADALMLTFAYPVSDYSDDRSELEPAQYDD